jgi:hypothetical protein
MMMGFLKINSFMPKHFGHSGKKKPNAQKTWGA